MMCGVDPCTIHEHKARTGCIAFVMARPRRGSKLPLSRAREGSRERELGQRLQTSTCFTTGCPPTPAFVTIVHGTNTSLIVTWQVCACTCGTGMLMCNSQRTEYTHTCNVGVNTSWTNLYAPCVHAFLPKGLCNKSPGGGGYFASLP